MPIFGKRQQKIYLMKKDNNPQPEKNQESKPDKTNEWIAKAEAYIDEAADKIHQSEAYRRTGKSVESATKKLFRQAGKWWGKSNFRK